MSVDPRGFKSLLQSEADTFLKEEQVRLNSTVSVISYTEGGVRVALTDGQILTADYVICTFRYVVAIGLTYKANLCAVWEFYSTKMSNSNLRCLYGNEKPSIA